mgnify:CR=1 FL=1
MLKNFKPVSLILVAGAMTLPVSASANFAPEKHETAISLQNGKVTGTVEPDPELAAKYEEKYQQFKQIYPACKPLFEIIK